VKPDVLVVEGEPDLRGSVAEILRGAGYEVREAGDGIEALAVLATQLVGVVLLDLRMPRCDGMALLDALVDPPPVLVVSAHHLGEPDRARLGPKVVAVLKKPVPPAQLLERVGAVLEAESARPRGER
jgi:two-component system, chemotaxis family, chemotaxis protein CheY